MKKSIYGIIALISAIFIFAFSIMLITNYFQLRTVTPFSMEVMETLREINRVEGENPVLQEQIRKIDLLARQAYFGHIHSITSGIIILLGMILVFVITGRLYYKGYKSIPDKEIDPIDEWAIKSKARTYVGYSVAVLATAAVVFAILTIPLFSERERDQEASETIVMLPEVQDYQGTEVFAFGADTPADFVPSPNGVYFNSFRGNNSSGISNARGLPTRWNLSAGTNIAWRTEVQRMGISSPVVHGNRVFITAADADARELLAYNLNTGALLWRLEAPGELNVNINGFYYRAMIAASTPTTNGNVVIAMFATTDVIAADMNGNMLWSKRLGDPDNHYGYASSPIIFGDLVIILKDDQANAFITALDINTGEEKWRTSRTGERMAWTTPMIAFVNNVPKVITVGQRNVIAYNPNSGQELWRQGGMGGEPGASASAANGIIYVAGDGARMMAIDGATGERLWENRHHLPDMASPVATTDNIFIGTNYGIIAAINAHDGSVRRTHEVPSRFIASPIIAEGRVYFINDEGIVFVLSADNEFRMIETFETGQSTYATPAFVDGRIIIRTGHLSEPGGILYSVIR